jgi:hypothetical protein
MDARFEQRPFAFATIGSAIFPGPREALNARNPRGIKIKLSRSFRSGNKQEYAPSQS